MSDPVSEPARRGPYAKGVAKREQILREALIAYAESDSSGPSLRSIAARVGLSERGLLHYFSSRDELFVAILAERDVADRGIVDVASTLDDLAAVQAHSSQTPGLVRLFLEMAAAAPDPASAAHDFFTTRYRVLRGLLERMLLQASETGDGDAAFAARMLIAASDGLQVQWLLDPSIDMRDDLRRLGELLQTASSPSSPSRASGTDHSQKT